MADSSPDAAKAGVESDISNGISLSDGQYFSDVAIDIPF